MDKNQFADLIKFVRSHDKIQHDGTAYKAEVVSINEMHIEPMRDETIEGLRRYSKVKDELRERVSETNKASIKIARIEDKKENDIDGEIAP